MTGSFVLRIDLGNDAMESPAHVAEALRELALRIDELPPDATARSGRVIDDNGNVVGKWAYKADTEEDTDE